MIVYLSLPLYNMPLIFLETKVNNNIVVFRQVEAIPESLTAPNPPRRARGIAIEESELKRVLPVLADAFKASIV